MDRNEARKAAEVMLAYAEGKEVEYFDEGMGKWLKCIDPQFQWSKKYRVKAESKYRPFESAKECWNEMQKHQPFGWIKGKGVLSKDEHLHISGIEIALEAERNLYFTIGKKTFDENKMFDDCVFADGTPFGVLEKCV